MLPRQRSSNPPKPAPGTTPCCCGGSLSRERALQRASGEHADAEPRRCIKPEGTYRETGPCLCRSALTSGFSRGRRRAANSSPNAGTLQAVRRHGRRPGTFVPAGIRISGPLFSVTRGSKHRHVPLRFHTSPAGSWMVHAPPPSGGLPDVPRDDSAALDAGAFDPRSLFT